MSSPLRRVPAAIFELSDESNSPPDPPALPVRLTQQQPELVTRPQRKCPAAVPVKRPAAGSEEDAGEHLQPEPVNTENEAEDEAETAPAVVGPRMKDDMPDRPRNNVKKRPASGSEDENRYRLMMYKNHGKSGTWALRDRVSGKQMVEMNWQGVTLEQSLAAAHICAAEMNCGLEPADAKELAQQFKAAYIARHEGPDL
jgi:hypothetical protein